MRRLPCWIMAAGATGALHLTLSGSAFAGGPTPRPYYVNSEVYRPNGTGSMLPAETLGTESQIINGRITRSFRGALGGEPT